MFKLCNLSLITSRKHFLKKPVFRRPKIEANPIAVVIKVISSERQSGAEAIYRSPRKVVAYIGYI